MKHLFSTLLLLASMSTVSAQTLVAVTDKAHSISGNKHNYESLSVYFWPNADKPGGIPYVEKDGQYNPEYKQYDLPRLEQLAANIRSFANAFLKTGDTKQYDLLIKQIDRWFIDRKTRMTPHFRYSQFAPGWNNGEGWPGGIIEAYNFISILDNIEAVDAQKSIGKTRMRKLKSWFADFAQWMQKSPQGKTERSSQNNHGLAYHVTLYRLAQFTDNKVLCDELIRSFAPERITPQIAADGSQPNELKRTRAMMYSTYNLQHMLDFCHMLHRQGINYIDGEGAPIKKAILFLYPYLGNKGKFHYQEIGDWKFEEERLKHEIRRCRDITKDPAIRNLKNID